MPGLEERHWKHPAMMELEMAIRKERLWQSICAGVLLLVCTWLVWQFLPHWTAWLAFAGIVLSTNWLLRLAPWQLIQNHRIFYTLTHHPDRVVWVYGLVTQMDPYGFRFMKQGVLYFKLENGKDLSVAVPGPRIKLISKFLNRVLPHATFGYSEEKEEQFKANPESLRRA